MAADFHALVVRLYGHIAEAERLFDAEPFDEAVVLAAQARAAESLRALEAAVLDHPEHRDGVTDLVRAYDHDQRTEPDDPHFQAVSDDLTDALLDFAHEHGVRVSGAPFDPRRRDVAARRRADPRGGKDLDARLAAAVRALTASVEALGTAPWRGGETLWPHEARMHASAAELRALALWLDPGPRLARIRRATRAIARAKHLRLTDGERVWSDVGRTVGALAIEEPPRSLLEN